MTRRDNGLIAGVVVAVKMRGFDALAIAGSARFKP
jgi:hypothetical protein